MVKRLTPGVVKSLLNPSRRELKGIFKRNSFSSLKAGSALRDPSTGVREIPNSGAIVAEVGKYSSRRVSLKKAEKLISGVTKLSDRERLKRYESGMKLGTRLF